MAYKFFEDNKKKSEDIDILGLLASDAIVEIRRGRLFKKYYVYYITEETNIILAQNIFKKYGINMEVHYSHVRGGYDKVLRVEQNKLDYDQSAFIKKISQVYEHSFDTNSRSNRMKVLSKINKLLILENNNNR